MKTIIEISITLSNNKKKKTLCFITYQFTMKSIHTHFHTHVLISSSCQSIIRTHSSHILTHHHITSLLYPTITSPSPPPHYHIATLSPHTRHCIVIFIIIIITHHHTSSLYYYIITSSHLTSPHHTIITPLSLYHHATTHTDTAQRRGWGRGGGDGHSPSHTR